MPDEPESSHTSKLVRRIVHSIENRYFANSLWTSSAARSSTIHIIKYSTNNGSTFNEIFQRDVETSLKPLLGYFDAIERLKMWIRRRRHEIAIEPNTISFNFLYASWNEITFPFLSKRNTYKKDIRSVNAFVVFTILFMIHSSLFNIRKEYR